MFYNLLHNEIVNCTLKTGNSNFFVYGKCTQIDIKRYPKTGNLRMRHRSVENMRKTIESKPKSRKYTICVDCGRS